MEKWNYDEHVSTFLSKFNVVWVWKNLTNINEPNKQTFTCLREWNFPKLYFIPAYNQEITSMQEY